MTRCIESRKYKGDFVKMKYFAYLSTLVFFVSTTQMLAKKNVVVKKDHVPTFQHEVRVVFESKCISCHGKDLVTESDLDLRSLKAIMIGGTSGDVIVPGKSKKSLLWQRIIEGDMPPEDETPLTDQEKQLIQDWINRGTFPTAEEIARSKSNLITAADREFWSFVKPTKHAPPSVKQANRVRNPIDAFILAHLEDEGLSFNPDADRQTLIRRVYFDLIGLPPTPQQVDDFVNNPDENAYENLVNQLLESHHYGERWARHWLDVAGYADSNGIEGDQRRLHAWRYRDYVIRALNSDRPYDQFVLEQLAGDELVDWRNTDEFTPEIVDTLAATGFLRCMPDGTNNLKLVSQVTARYETLSNSVEVAMEALMGLSVGCAKCHNHKFDPIPQVDFYKLMAAFVPAYNPNDWRAGYEFPPKSGNMRLIPLISQEELDRQASRNSEIDQQIKSLDKRINELAKELIPDAAARKQKNSRRKKQFPDFAAKIQPLEDQIVQLDKQRPKPPEYVRALWDVSINPPATHLFKRGDHRTPTEEEVRPGALAVLEGAEWPFGFEESNDQRGETTGRRSTLAKWLTQPDHPLTARVFVNRVWQHHFGRGIVATPSDFGVQGARPTHPKLLDWLAVTFVEGDWSIKELHQLILHSTAYRQAAIFRPKAANVDPECQLLWRKPPLRLEGEIVRDAILAVSGSLDRRPFGKPDPIRKARDGQYVAVEQVGQKFRRSIYVYTPRATLMNFLRVFDAPVMARSIPERQNSTVPSQSLALMNNEFVVSQARRFAARVRADVGEDRQRQLKRAFLLAMGRSPELAEQNAMLAALSEPANADQSTDNPNDQLNALENLCLCLIGANEFLYVD